MIGLFAFFKPRKRARFPTMYESDNHALLSAVHAMRALVQYGCTPQEVLESVSCFDLTRPPEST